MGINWGRNVLVHLIRKRTVHELISCRIDTVILKGPKKRFTAYLSLQRQKQKQNKASLWVEEFWWTSKFTKMTHRTDTLTNSIFHAGQDRINIQTTTSDHGDGDGGRSVLGTGWFLRSTSQPLNETAGRIHRRVCLDHCTVKTTATLTTETGLMITTESTTTIMARNNQPAITASPTTGRKWVIPY